MAIQKLLGRILLFFIILLPGLIPQPAEALSGDVVIATGSAKGVYYPIGKAIAKIANKYSEDASLRFMAVPGKGSVDNIKRLLKGQVQMALVQSDRAFQAVNGLGPWKGKGKQTRLRSILSLYSESVTLMATVKSGIKCSRDLKGKRVSLGTKGSGTRQNAEEVLKAAGLKAGDLKEALGYDAARSAQLLQSGEIDAFFYTVGHPNKIIYRLVKGKVKVRFVQIPCKDLWRLNETYLDTWIPLKFYRKAANTGFSHRTCGVVATLITRADVPKKVVYQVMMTLYENCKEFCKCHRVISGWEPKKAIDAHWGLYATYHPGAVEYLKERGISYKGR